ncbi:MAG: NAD-dependent epimerase/dehydratase family protein [Pararhizobium sp.]
MTVLVTGGTGFVGRFIVEHLLAAGRSVAVAGRTPPAPGFFTKPVGFRPLDLDPGTISADLFDDVEALVHAAFHHVAGRYRGGEGDAPEAFVRRNRDGTIALFKAAKAAGATRCVFLSSRAVYGTQPPGVALTEETEPHPDTLYGEVKFSAERALTALTDGSFAGVSLRVTGVYGPAGRGQVHKWDSLFEDYLSGRPITPRCGTEVHGDDLAEAVRLVLEQPPDALPTVLNLSDIAVERRDILATLAEAAGARFPLPDAAGNADLNSMDASPLASLGWRPGGRPLLEATVRAMARDFLMAEKGA